METGAIRASASKDSGSVIGGGGIEEMAKLKISGKVPKRHLIALLEDRIEQLERRVEDLENQPFQIYYYPAYPIPQTFCGNCGKPIKHNEIHICC